MTTRFLEQSLSGFKFYHSVKYYKNALDEMWPAIRGKVWMSIFGGMSGVYASGYYIQTIVDVVEKMRKCAGK